MNRHTTIPNCKPCRRVAIYLVGESRYDMLLHVGLCWKTSPSMYQKQLHFSTGKDSNKRNDSELKIKVFERFWAKNERSCPSANFFVKTWKKVLTNGERCDSISKRSREQNKISHKPMKIGMNLGRNQRIRLKSEACKFFEMTWKKFLTIGGECGRIHQVGKRLTRTSEKT